MKINVSVYSHLDRHDCLAELGIGETFETPNFKVVDFEQEEMERDTILLSAALLVLPKEILLELDGDHIEIAELGNQMVQVDVYIRESPEDTLDEMVHKTTMNIAYIEE